MTILNFNAQITGIGNANVRFITVETDNTEAEVLASGFIDGSSALGKSVKEGDMALVGLKESGIARTGWYQISRDGDNWSFVLPASSSDLEIGNVKTFLTSGTWTKPSGFTSESFVEVSVLGGGAGSGGTSATGAGEGSASAGGGGGAFVLARIAAADLANTETVTVGAGGVGGAAGNSGGTGGTSSFGAHLSCTGGVAGEGDGNGTGTGDVSLPSGGGTVTAGGTANVIFSIGGGRSNGGYLTANIPSNTNFGGGSYLCAITPPSPIDAAPIIPTGLGGGAAGARTGASAAALTGGAGTPGIIIVREYY